MLMPLPMLLPYALLPARLCWRPPCHYAMLIFFDNRRYSLQPRQLSLDIFAVTLRYLMFSAAAMPCH